MSQSRSSNSNTVLPSIHTHYRYSTLPHAAFPRSNGSKTSSSSDSSNPSLLHPRFPGDRDDDSLFQDDSIFERLQEQRNPKKKTKIKVDASVEESFQYSSMCGIGLLEVSWVRATANKVTKFFRPEPPNGKSSTTEQMTPSQQPQQTAQQYASDESTASFSSNDSTRSNSSSVTSNSSSSHHSRKDSSTPPKSCRLQRGRSRGPRRKLV
jgi:hypothetical protein